MASAEDGFILKDSRPPHTMGQLDWLYDKVDAMIDMFDDATLKEFSGGYMGDVNRLMNVIEEEAINIFNGVPHPVTDQRFYNLTNVTKSLHESLKVLNYNYFKHTMMPDFYLAQHSIQWGNIVQIYDRSCILASRGLGKSHEFSFALPIWKMYGYRKPTDFNPVSLDIARRREGLIVTNKYELGYKLLDKIVTEIKANDAIGEKLRPPNKSEGFLGSKKIKTKNGCEINLRSADATARGLHPDLIVVDDYGNNNWIWVKEQRDKGIANFYGDVMKTIERGGTVNVVGTPFHEKDLYAHIRNNDKTFKYFEYPAIMPDGTIVAPHRWNLKELDNEYAASGPIIFSREMLVVPMSDGSTIFPWEMLEKSFIGMHDFRLVHNRDSFPIKFKYVSVGCDFAISGNIKDADATVFSVWGVDDYENFWLLYIWRKQGASHNEQIAKLKEIERNFRPNEIVAESNGFQRVMLSIGRDHGIKNITNFNTDGWNKKDLYDGLPGLAILFNQGRIRLPRGDMYSKEMADWLCSEFNSITVKPDTGKLESAGEHDDGPMSCWFGIKCISVNKEKKLNFMVI